MIKRIISLIIASVLLLSVFTGCQSSKQTPAPDGTTVNEPAANDTEVQDDGSKLLEYTWLGWNLQGILPVEGSVVQKYLEKEYNIKITNVMVDSYNLEQLNVMLATGLEFDVWTNGKDIKSAYDSGLVRELPEGMISEYCPTVMDILQKESPDGTWRAVASVDGKLYGIPSVSYSYQAPISAVTRSDWMQNLGVTKAPETLDELKELFARMRTDDPDKNGKKDTYALSKFDKAAQAMDNICPYIFASFGSALNTWLIGEDGSAKWYAIDEGYKNGLRVLSDWYKSEIFDPEVVLDTRKEVTAKFVNDKLGAFFGTEWALNVGHPSSPWESMKDKQPDVKPFLLPPVKGSDGKARTQQYSDTVPANPVVYFGKNTSDEKVVRVLKMFDDIFSDMDLYKLVAYGNEGEHYDITEGGIVVKPDFVSKEAQTNIGPDRFFNAQFAPEGYFKIREQKGRLEAADWVKGYEKIQRHPYSPMLVPAEAEYKEALAKIEQEFFWNVFVGAKDVDKEWDNYVKQWKAVGGDKVLAEKNEEYQKYLQSMMK